MTIFQCAIKIVTDRSDFFKGIGWKKRVFFKSIYYLIYTKGWKIFLLTEFSIFYLKILQKIGILFIQSYESVAPQT